MTRAWTLLAACTLTFALSDRVHAAPPAKPKAKATTKSKPTQGKNRPGAKTKKKKKKKGTLGKKSVKATGPGVSMKKGMTLIRPAGTKLPDPPSAPAEIKSEQATQGKVKAAAAPADQLIALKKVELTPRRPAVGRVFMDAWNASWSARANQLSVNNAGLGQHGAVQIRAMTNASGLVLQFRCEGSFQEEMGVYGRHWVEDSPFYSTTHHAEFTHVDDVLNFTLEFDDDQTGPYEAVLYSPNLGSFILRSCEVEWR